MSTVLGQTTNVNESAVFGRNDSTETASAPSGSGVFGLTVTDKGVGVFGANNNPNTGRGVQGNGAEAGVGGFSDGGLELSLIAIKEMDYYQLLTPKRRVRCLQVITVPEQHRLAVRLQAMVYSD